MVIAPDVASLLAELSLSDLGPILVTLGAKNLAFLDHIEESDLTGAGVPVLQARALLRAVSARVRKQQSKVRASFEDSVNIF